MCTSDMERAVYEYRISCALLLPLADRLLDAVELSSTEPFEH